MKSFLLFLAISALIINQSYKKKAAAIYLGEAVKEENGSSLPQEAINAPQPSFADLKERGDRLIPLRITAPLTNNTRVYNFAAFAIHRY